MADEEHNPPLWLTTQGHDAEMLRRWVQTVMWDHTGVVGASDFVVTKVSGLQLAVAPGRIVIAGTNVPATQGYYFQEMLATKLVDITAGDATRPRKDRVVAYVRDSAYAGDPGDDGWLVDVIEGTPSATPAEPPLPKNVEELALVDVPAGAASVAQLTVTDRRRVLLRPGVMAFTTALQRSVQFPNPAVGDISLILNPVSGTGARHEWWNGVSWVRLVPRQVVSTAAPAANAPGEDGDIWWKVG